MTFLTLLCCSLSGASRPLYADKDDQNKSTIQDKELEATLKNIQEVHEGLKTLKAEFKQLKVHSMLLEPVKTTGNFYYEKPDKMNWEYNPPDQMQMVLNGDILIMYYPDLKQADKINISKHREYIGKVMGIGQSISTLAEFYQIQFIRSFVPSEEPARSAVLPDELSELEIKRAELGKKLSLLVLIPKKLRIKKRLSKIRLWVAEELWLPTLIQYFQPDGDMTLMFFKDIEKNVELDSGIFELDIPDDVKVKERGRKIRD